MSIEEIKKLKESIRAYQEKIPKLRESLAETIKAQNELDDVALKAEILEEKGWQRKKEAADKNRAEISEIKAKIQKCEEQIQHLEERGRKLRPEIMKEFKKKFYTECAGDLKEYGKLLKKAAEYEADLIKRRKQVEWEIRTTLHNGMGIGPVELPATVIPAFAPFLTAGPFTPENMNLYRYFVKTCEEQGIRIE